MATNGNNFISGLLPFSVLGTLPKETDLRVVGGKVPIPKDLPQHVDTLMTGTLYKQQ
jgi:hypothetical protein